MGFFLIFIVLVPLLGVVCLLALVQVLLDGGISRRKAAAVSSIYFLITNFMLFGFSSLIPICGTILTLPWSMLLSKVHFSSTMVGFRVLETCVLTNAVALFFLLGRKSK